MNTNKSIRKIATTIQNAPAYRWSTPCATFLKYDNACINSHENPDAKGAKKDWKKAKKHLAQFLAQVRWIESVLPRAEHITKGFNLKNPKRLSQFLKYYDSANIYLARMEDKLHKWLLDQKTALKAQDGKLRRATRRSLPLRHRQPRSTAEK